jgi:hypothetical protein
MNFLEQYGVPRQMTARGPQAAAGRSGASCTTGETVAALSLTRIAYTHNYLPGFRSARTLHSGQARREEMVQEMA